MQYKENEIKKGIKLHEIQTDKFKTNLIAVFLTMPITRENVTKNALISAVLRRGSKNMPTLAQISKDMEEMYGASFDCGIDKTGDNHVLKFYIETINDNYIPQKDENMLKTAIEKLLEIIFNPLIENNSFKQEYIDAMLDRYKYKNLEDMYAAVGFGANSAVKVIAKMLQEYRKEHQEEDIEEKIEELRKQKERKQKPSSSGVVVEGIDNCLVKLSKCCNPLPGDEIIGYITKGRGVSVHRKDCVNVKDLLSEENRIIDVKWYEEAKESYNVTIEALANDRKGLLVDILNSIKETKANLMGVSTKTTKERIAIMDINIEVENIEELNKVIRNIKKVDSVYEVRR